MKQFFILGQRVNTYKFGLDVRDKGQTMGSCVKIYRSYMIETTRSRGDGKTAEYVWIQGWTMKSPNDGEYAPETLADMRQLAAQVYPGRKIVVEK